MFEGFDGADKMDGKDGSDTASYLNAPIGVEVSLELGKGFTGHAKGDTFINIENLIGSEFNDILISSKQGGSIDGRGGDNTIATSGGSDNIKCGAGVDSIQIHPTQKIAFIEGFDLGADTVSILGAISLNDLNVKPFDKDSTVVEVPKSGTKVVFQGIPADKFQKNSIKIYDETEEGGENSCPTTGTLIKGSCFFAPPAGYIKKNGKIQKCDADGCQICTEE